MRVSFWNALRKKKTNSISLMLRSKVTQQTHCVFHQCCFAIYSCVFTDAKPCVFSKRATLPFRCEGRSKVQTQKYKILFPSERAFIFFWWLHTRISICCPYASYRLTLAVGLARLLSQLRSAEMNHSCMYAVRTSHRAATAELHQTTAVTSWQRGWTGLVSSFLPSRKQAFPERSTTKFFANQCNSFGLNGIGSIYSTRDLGRQLLDNTV